MQRDGQSREEKVSLTGEYQWEINGVIVHCWRARWACLLLQRRALSGITGRGRKKNPHPSPFCLSARFGFSSLRFACFFLSFIPQTKSLSHASPHSTCAHCPPYPSASLLNRDDEELSHASHSTVFASDWISTLYPDVAFLKHGESKI